MVVTDIQSSQKEEKEKDKGRKYLKISSLGDGEKKKRQK
jgi:hypothetical protein